MRWGVMVAEGIWVAGASPDVAALMRVAIGGVVIAVATAAKVAFVVGVTADGAAPAQATSEIANAKDKQNRSAPPIGPSVTDLAKPESRPRVIPVRELAAPLSRTAEFLAGSRAR